MKLASTIIGGNCSKLGREWLGSVWGVAMKKLVLARGGVGGLPGNC